MMGSRIFSFQKLRSTLTFDPTQFEPNLAVCLDAVYVLESFWREANLGRVRGPHPERLLFTICPKPQLAHLSTSERSL
jgi:hypothetical protein